MNVLSLFDGMSCGQIALNKLGIKYDKYFACEIDKYAMQVTQHNFPDTIQLGDVQFVTKETFGTHKIDLVIGGSPCQGFSFAGKQLNFEDPRSALFFEFVRLVKELKPKYFLLENVKMKKESQDIISKYMGVEPIEINSSLVSAQTRKRLYWTNIPNVSQPEDKGVVLRDIIESGCIDDRMVNEGKSHCLTARYSGAVWWNSIERKQRTMISLEQVDNKLRHQEATKKGYAEAGEGEGLDLTFPESKTRRGRAMKDKSNCLTAAGHEMGVVYNEEDIDNVDTRNKALDKTINKFSDSIDEEVILDSYNKSIHREKSPTITTRVSASNKTHVVKIDPSKPNQINPDAYNDKKLSWRKLTPLECERLQTVPDGYSLVLDDKGKQLVSDSQRYKMLGNGWTIDVITHIMKNMEL
jgi:DNA-cytosine methyltransferase